VHGGLQHADAPERAALLGGAGRRRRRAPVRRRRSGRSRSRSAERRGDRPRDERELRAPKNAGRAPRPLRGRARGPGQRELGQAGPHGARRRRDESDVNIVDDAPRGRGFSWFTQRGQVDSFTGRVVRPAEGADYPFTTLVPNLGVTEPKRFGLDDAESATWLDIPGLVAGAADGKGLGLAFLRHTERCRVLLHLVDGASDDVVRDVLGINAELRAYSAKLANTPQAVLVTKTDLTHVRDALQPKLDAIAEAVGHDRVLAVSSASGDNLKDLVIKSNRLLRGAARLRRTRAGAGATAVEPRGAPDAP